MPGAKKFKFIGCEVLYREACSLAAASPNRVDLEFMPKGLHDLPTEDMRAKLQQAIDAASQSDIGYDAILLGYGRCNDGTVGLEAKNIPLVCPKAHDCITLFLGSARQYQKYFDSHPGTYFQTTGWLERENLESADYGQPAYGMQGVMGKLGLADSYEKMVEKYGREQADYIAQTLGDWKHNYKRCCYVRMGVCDERDFVDEARRTAEQRSWDFELCDGSLELLEKLFAGRWDGRFVVVPPGGKIISRNDGSILDVSENR